MYITKRPKTFLQRKVRMYKTKSSLPDFEGNNKRKIKFRLNKLSSVEFPVFTGPNDVRCTAKTYENYRSR